MPLVEAQAAFAAAGQMLALDPPLGEGDAATIGGVMATNDTGPLRHRYGGMRDLVVGITVVLSDGTIAKSGGKVIKNVAGYDLAKLFTGSFGTLGLIATVAVRLHPAPARTATLTAGSRRPGRARACRARARGAAARGRLPRRRLGGRRRLARPALRRRHRGRARARRRGRTSTLDDVDDRRRRPRGRGRCAAGSQRGELVVEGLRPPDRPRDRDRRGAAARRHGRLARRARASWISYPAGADVAALREALAPRACTVLDGADRVEDPWPAVDPGALAVMERIKARFDPGARSGRARSWEDCEHGDQRLGRHPAARAGPDQGLRALRVLPADVPELRGVRGGDGLAARADRADADRPRGGQRGLAGDDHAPRPLPRLHGVRDRLPVGRPVRPADRAGAAADRAPRPAHAGASARCATGIFALFTHPGRLRAAVPFMALQQRLKLPVPFSELAPKVPLRAGDAAAARGHARASARSAAGSR